MAALNTDDFTNINDPKTPREMFQKIMHLIEQSAEDRQEDRDMLLGFVDSFNKSQKAQDDCVISHIKDYNDIVTPALVKVGTFIKIVTWVGTTLGAGVLVLILGILTGQVILVKP